jgi:hypothetical protein
MNGDQSSSYLPAMDRPPVGDGEPGSSSVRSPSPATDTPRGMLVRQSALRTHKLYDKEDQSSSQSIRDRSSSAPNIHAILQLEQSMMPEVNIICDSALHIHAHYMQALHKTQLRTRQEEIERQAVQTGNIGKSMCTTRCA